MKCQIPLAMLFGLCLAASADTAPRLAGLIVWVANLAIPHTNAPTAKLARPRTAITYCSQMESPSTSIFLPWRLLTPPQRPRSLPPVRLPARRVTSADVGAVPVNNTVTAGLAK